MIREVRLHLVLNLPTRLVVLLRNLLQLLRAAPKVLTFTFPWFLGLIIIIIIINRNLMFSGIFF